MPLITGLKNSFWFHWVVTEEFERNFVESGSALCLTLLWQTLRCHAHSLSPSIHRGVLQLTAKSFNIIAESFNTPRSQNALFNGLWLPLDGKWREKSFCENIFILNPKSRAGHATILSRQCDNVIRPHKVVCDCHFTIFIMATPSTVDSRHWGLTIFRFFSGPWRYITLSHCRCREAKKLSHAQLFQRVSFNKDSAVSFASLC